MISRPPSIGKSGRFSHVSLEALPQITLRHAGHPRNEPLHYRRQNPLIVCPGKFVLLSRYKFLGCYMDMVEQMGHFSAVRIQYKVNVVFSFLVSFKAVGGFRRAVRLRSLDSRVRLRSSLQPNHSSLCGVLKLSSLRLTGSFALFSVSVV